MRRFRRIAFPLAVIGLTTLAARAQTANDLGPVDFRYSPPWWQSALCLPDDPDKILVGKDGELLLDFGQGGVRNFGICIQPAVVGETRWVRQETVSPRAPIVRTWKDAGGIEIVEDAFVVIPRPAPASESPRLTRHDGDRRFANWAKPARRCAAAFTGADVSDPGRPIELRLRVTPGGRATLAFGLCEGWHKEAGQRPLVLRAEGATPKTVDPVADFGFNQPGIYELAANDADGDGVITIEVATPETGPDRNAILNALWAFDRDPGDDAAIVTGEVPAFASYAGTTLPERTAVIVVQVRNTRETVASVVPELVVQAVGPVREVPEGGLAVGESTRVLATEPLHRVGANAAHAYVLAPVSLQPGATRQFAWTVVRNGRGTPEPLDVAKATALRDEAQQWWERLELPYRAVVVPDPGIQAIIESCVRNIWQAREIKRGLPAFHVGPTVYRGLWVVDGSFLLEAAAMLGRADDARAGIEYLLGHQKPDGSFEILPLFWKENGIVLWAATRHAQLTQDQAWLRAHWPALQAVVRALQTKRAQARSNPESPEFGLLPPGQIDGGIWNSDKPEYSNTYWCLAGLRAAVEAARWLGDDTSAQAWQTELDDFLAAYRKAAARDTLRDLSGNAYVPTLMRDIDHHLPQRGQWAFCHAVYPGQVFPLDDPLVAGQLAMLRATKRQGLVFDTGWMRGGIWTYFASFYGHAALWQGQGREAAEVLYDFARHASPVRVWREEQKPVGEGADEVGDMPHNWASAEFLRLCIHLIELDRGDELHLLEGFPHEWAGPGKISRLNGVLTPFGPLNLAVEVAADGTSVHVSMKRLTARPPTRIVLHLAGLTGEDRTIELPTDRDVEETLTR